jgi:mono/diheme cytochrome c family protein
MKIAPRKPSRRTAALVFVVGSLAFLAITSPLAAPLTSPCPQPRFTGKAPDEFLARVNPIATGGSTAEAQRIYAGDGQTIACATCHGRNGDGQGPMAKLFDPPPRNFRCAQTIAGVPDGQLFWVIRFGSPGTSMPPHPKFSDEQIWRLVAHLREIAR